MSLVHGLLLLAQVQVLVPIERPQTAADQIRRLCPIASPRDHERLVHLENQLTQSALKKDVSPDIRDSLGCVHALLALNASLDREGEPSKPIGTPQAEEALGDLVKALDSRPSDTQAAELVAALSQQATAAPTAVRAMLLDDLAMAMFNAVKTGVTSPAVLRACTRLMIAVNDLATARNCSDRAMKRGQDSTWHLLRLAQATSANGDAAVAASLFERAARAAHDSAAMNELLYPFFTEADWTRWLSLPDSGRGRWLRDSLFADKIYQSASWASRLAVQLAGPQQTGGRSYYWWCMPQLPAECMQPGAKGETVVRTAARFNQFWDAATGAPLALITFGVRIGDLASEKIKASRLAEVEVAIHTWDEAARQWSDTTIQRQLRYPATTAADAFVNGRVVIPTSLGVTSWSIRVSQSKTRRGRTADDQHTPISSGPLRLSDLMVMVMPADSQNSKPGKQAAVLAPLGHLRRPQRVQLFFQLWGTEDHPRLKVVLALRDPFAEAFDATPTIQLTFDETSKRGLNEFSRILDVYPGSYQVQVLVMDEVSGAMVKRVTTLQVD